MFDGYLMREVGELRRDVDELQQALPLFKEAIRLLSWAVGSPDGTWERHTALMELLEDKESGDSGC